jgi:SNF2 family DNA or RNA helicase
LKKTQSRKKVAFMHSRLSIRERHEIIQGFEDARDGNGEYIQSNRPDILLGTTGILGTGFNCVRAFRLVLLEPDYVWYNEEQAVGRIHRYGQKNPQTFTYRLVCKESEVEAAIVDRQQKRKLFQRMTLERSRIDESQVVEISSEGSDDYDPAMYA